MLVLQVWQRALLHPSVRILHGLPTMRTRCSRFSPIAVIACVGLARIRTYAAKKAWATAGATAKSAVIAVPTALGYGELAKTRMSVASVVRAIADATVRNAASHNSLGTRRRCLIRTEAPVACQVVGQSMVNPAWLPELLATKVPPGGRPRSCQLLSKSKGPLLAAPRATHPVPSLRLPLDSRNSLQLPAATRWRYACMSLCGAGRRITSDHTFVP